jgi:hypothetical protein
MPLTIMKKRRQDQQHCLLTARVIMIMDLELEMTISPLPPFTFVTPTIPYLASPSPETPSRPLCYTPTPPLDVPAINTRLHSRSTSTIEGVLLRKPDHSPSFSVNSMISGFKYSRKMLSFSLQTHIVRLFSEAYGDCYFLGCSTSEFHYPGPCKRRLKTLSLIQGTVTGLVLIILVISN